MAKVKYLDAKVVNLYVKLSCYENKLHKAVEKLKKSLKEKLQDGFVCPDNVPVQVKLNKFGGQPERDVQAEPDWRNEFRNFLLKAYNGNVERADAVLKKVQDSQPLVHYDAVEPTVRLEKETNEKMYDKAKAAETEWEMEVEKLSKAA